jgi:hypothetical protein
MNQQKQESPPIEHKKLSHVHLDGKRLNPGCHHSRFMRHGPLPKFRLTPQGGVLKACGSLSCSASMRALSGLKSSSLIAFSLVPQGKDHSDPNIGERPDGLAMTFALSPFALIVVSCPRLLFGCLPSKLMQGMAPGFTTGITPMCFGVGSALKKDWRGPGQGCQAGAIPIAAPVIADFGQQSRSKPREGPRQGAPCLHASKKGQQSPCRTQQSPQPMAGVGSPKPLSGELWCAW